MARKTRRPTYRLQVHYEVLGIKGFVVIDSLVNGLSAGGLRMREGLTQREVQRLARTMTHKFAASQIPIGGAKAGIAADPRRPDKDEIIANFGRLIKPLLAEMYLAGEDMGTARADLANLYRAAELNPVAVAKKRMSSVGITIDLPDDFDLLSDDSNLDELMTGYGIAECTEEACVRLDMNLPGATVAIQGFGNVGSGTARFLTEKGAKIVAVADVDGTIYSDHGLPVGQLLAARDELGPIDRKKLECSFSEHPRDEWLATKAEILIPAAAADTITTDNVENISARLVIEAANIPITLAAEKRLHHMGIPVIPDFIANAGAACGFGLLLSGQAGFDPQEVLQEIGSRIRNATAKVIGIARKRRALPRRAAEAIAEEELAKIKEKFK